jgi:competence protein ComGC
MNTTIDKKKVYISVLIIICFLLISQLFSKCESEKVQLANVKALNSKVQVYKLKNGDLVTSVENLSYTNSQLKNSIIMKDKKVKELTSKFTKVKAVTKFVTNTNLDTITLTYRDSIPCNFKKIDSLSNQWYNISYQSNQKGIEITKLNISDSVIVVTGDKRKWFWGKRTSVTDITHANPFVKTESIQHIEVKEKTKWYNSTIFKVGIGFIGGALLLQ